MTWDALGIETVLNNAITLPEGLLGQVPYRTVVYRMLQSLYQRQTQHEQVAGYTKQTNGVGFSSFDSPILSGIAEGSKQYQSLTPKQTALVARKLIKYRKQLAAIAAERLAAPIAA